MLNLQYLVHTDLWEWSKVPCLKTIYVKQAIQTVICPIDLKSLDELKVEDIVPGLGIRILSWSAVFLVFSKSEVFVSQKSK